MSKKHKSSKSNDRTEEAIDWLESVGGDMLDCGVDPDGLVEMSMDAVSQAFPSATFREQDIQAAAESLA